MKINQTLFVFAGLILSTSVSNAYTIYGTTTVNGTSYNLSPSATLNGANLSNANLNSADLSGASLTYANLGGTVLTGANLTGANIGWSNLSGADLTYANLTNANLGGGDLTYADLTCANLSGANLYGAYLAHADLCGAVLTGANFAGVNLTGTIVSYSNWTDFVNQSGALNLASYTGNTKTIIFGGVCGCVPEPSTYGLMLGGLALAAVAIRRRKKTA